MKFVIPATARGRTINPRNLTMKPFQFSRSLSTGIVVGLISAAVLGYSLHTSAQDKGDKDSKEKAAAATKAALTVSTVRPESADWPQRLSASGSIAAWQEAIVGSEIGGLRLTEVAVDVGDRVRKGQLLARLQNETVSAEREQTRASMAEAGLRRPKRRPTPTVPARLRPAVP